MTPGVNIKRCTVGDQNYRRIEEIDTDIVIVGRGIYNSDNYIESAENFRLVNTKKYKTNIV